MAKFWSIEHDSILKCRRSNNYLNIDKLSKLYPNVKSIHESVKNVLLNYPKPEEINNILVTGGCGFIGSNFINFIFDITKY